MRNMDSMSRCSRYGLLSCMSKQMQEHEVGVTEQIFKKSRHDLEGDPRADFKANHPKLRSCQV